MTLQDGQIYVYCYHPSNSFAYSSYEDIPATPAEHNMLKHVVIESTIPNDPQDKTFDGTTWANISGLQAERNLFALRSQRDRLITETDWWMVPDRTATDEQIAYRQALRDITETYTSLDDVVWPAKPA